MRVRFFNTYEPVTTFCRDLLPYLAKQGIAAEVLIAVSLAVALPHGLDIALADTFQIRGKSGRRIHKPRVLARARQQGSHDDKRAEYAGHRSPEGSGAERIDAAPGTL